MASKLYSYGYLFVEKNRETSGFSIMPILARERKAPDWGTVPNTSVACGLLTYNTANKPSASDVGALPITGGRLNGPLSIGNTDNALGGN